MTAAREATLATLVALAIDASLRNVGAFTHPATSWTAEQIADANLGYASDADVRSTRAGLGQLRREGHVTARASLGSQRWRPTVAGIRAVLA